MTSTSASGARTDTGAGAQADTLLMLSGGIDSVAALYGRLRAGLVTRTHHVRLSNWEGRAEAERRAVRAVLTLVQREFPGLVVHTESSFDYGDLRYIVRDHHVWGLMAGVILADPKNASITRVLRTFHRDSVIGGLDSPAGRAAERAWREPIERIARRPVDFDYVQLGQTKAEIIASLPDRVLRLCWWCRRPQAGRACHECHTCRQVDAALSGNPLPPLDERSA